MKSKWLYQKSKTGKIVKWRVWNEDKYLYTEFGQVDGKLQTSAGQECFPTNEDRSNARTAEQQAVFEAEALYKHKLDTKYSETPDIAEEGKISPMLAQDGHKCKIEFPCDIQPKLDGARCMIVWQDKEPKLMSRGNKFYDVKHILEDIKKMLKPGQMLDGELYIHGMSLQNIMSLIKKPKPGSENLRYFVYDMPGPEEWEERYTNMADIRFTDYVIQLDTYKVKDLDGIKKAHDNFIEHGYEGAIIRLLNGKYEYGKRSRALLKWKEFEDAEFKILDVEAGTGKFEGVPTFTVQNDINDNTFRVVPTGTQEVRKELLNRKYIGQLITVKFLGRTDDGIPKIPVGKCIREE